MLANSLVGCLHRELLQVLTCQDPSFKNEVIGALFSSLDLLFIEVPVDELVTYPPAQQPLQSPGALACRTATISSAKGRTGNELLVDINTGMSTPKLVAVHYAKLLRHASLDALLVLAEKLDVSLIMHKNTDEHSLFQQFALKV